MANETVGIDVVARLDQFRSELAKIPDIGGKEAKALVGQLSREIKAAERASQGAARAAASHAIETGRLTAATFKAELGMEALKKTLDLSARAIGAVVNRAVELSAASGGQLAPAMTELQAASDGLTDALALGLTPILTSVAQGLADVVGGAVAATRELFGLNEATKQNAAAQAAANAQIERQAEKVEQARAALRAMQELAKGGIFNEEDVARTSDELQRQLAILRRLKGELAPVAKAAPAAAAPAAAGRAPRASGGGGASAGPSASPAAALIAEVEEASTAGADALRELRAVLADVAAAGLDAQGQIKADARAQVEAIRAALAEITSSREIDAEVKFQAIRDAAAAEIEVEKQKQAALDEIRNEAAQRRRDQIAAEKEAQQRAAVAWVGNTSSAVGSISALIGEVTSAVAQSEKANTKERKAALKKAWEAQTALAIAQAAINIPLSIAQAAAGPWPAAIGFMVAAGVASAAAFAGVVAKAAAGPTFHAGGPIATGPTRRPEHEDEISITALEGEGVLNRAAMRRVGQEGLRAMNRGEQPVIQIQQRLGHRVLDEQIAESLARRAGPLYDAISSARPRAGTYATRL